jgi:tight adherence protein B
LDWFFLILIFLSVALTIVASYFVVGDLKRRDERLAMRRVEEFRKGVAPAESQESPVLFEKLKEFDLGEFARPRSAPAPALIPALLRRDWLRPLRDALVRSGLKLRVNQVLTVSAALALLLGALGLWWQGLLLGLPGFFAGAAAPLVYVGSRARARRDRFVAQLGGAFELMARVIRSGQSVPQAFRAVADSCEEPIAGAFARCCEQQNLGLPPETAFQELAEHSGVLEMRIFVMAMVIQRQFGGNLSDVLERLALLIRERRRVRQQIRTLTAEGRMQAAVLLVLPFFMFMVMRFLNRPYADELLQQPWLLAAMVVVMGIGALWIRKIVNFEF